MCAPIGAFARVFGRRALAGLLAVGIAAFTAGSRSFAAIGQWAADASPDVLAGLGAARTAAARTAAAAPNVKNVNSPNP
jgi:hypothetical protein